MIRAILVGAVIFFGGLFALRGAFPALLFYIWIAYFRPESWVWGDWAASLQLSFLAGGYLVVRSLMAPGSLRWDWRATLWLIFLLHNAASVAVSLYEPSILEPFINFTKSIIVAYLISCLAADAGRFRQVLVVIAVSLGAEAAKQGWLQLILNPGGQNNNDIPFLGDNNAVAVGMLMLVPILVALARTSNSRWERWGHRFIAVGVVYRAVSTYSRGGFLACLALASIYVLRSKRRAVSVAAVIVIGVLLVPVLPEAFWNRMDTILVDSDERDRSAAGRLYFWGVAVEMANANPLLGVGHFGFNHAYNQFDTSGGEYGDDRSVHSIWFGVLAELGYPGFLLFIAILFIHWRTLYRVRTMARNGTVPAELGHYAFALEASLLVFVVGGSFLPIQYNEMLWHFIALGVALYGAATVVEQSKAVVLRHAPVTGAGTAFPRWLPPLAPIRPIGASVAKPPARFSTE